MQATRRYKVSCELALQQLNTYLDKQSLDRVKYAEAFDARAARYSRWRQSLRDLEVPSPEGIVTVPYLSSRLRQHLPDDTVIVIEAVTNAIPIIHHLNLTKVCVPLTSPLTWLTPDTPARLALRQRRRRPRLGRRCCTGRQNGQTRFFHLRNVSSRSLRCRLS